MFNEIKTKIKYAATVHLPDGTSCTEKLFSTKEEAEHYAAQQNKWLLDDEEPMTVHPVRVHSIVERLD